MEWLLDSPILILISIAFVAFLESFALLGLLVPGVVLLFSLSALANAADIHIFQMLLSAAIGAMVGDFSSYFIGRHFQHRITDLAWFSRHQSWLEQGEWFIKKWGWLSVIVGRFLGPLRPIIPVVAGTLGMPPKQFIPLSSLTVFAWAPAYLLPGFFTGELSELWQVQPLSTRSLVIYILTAIAVSATALALYHHAHPERWHLRGWITRHQADRWPITSTTLTIVSLIGFFFLQFAPPAEQNQLFFDWSTGWQASTLDPIWKSINRLSHPDFVTLIFAVICVWLALANRLGLAFLGFITFALLSLTGTKLEHWNHALILAPDAHHLGGLMLYVFCLGVMANIVSSRLHSLKRWPIYLMTSQFILLGTISHLWEGTLALSLAGQAIFAALAANGLFRAAWQQLHLPLKLCAASPVFILIVLTATAWAII